MTKPFLKRPALSWPSRDWPVIMLSTCHDELARHDARSVGARFLLNKPVDAQALIDAIAWVTEGER